MTKRPRLQTNFEEYTQKHLAQILKSIALRPECDRTEFVRKLNEIAWHGSSWEEITAAEGTPSERERRFRARAKQTAELADWLEELYLYEGSYRWVFCRRPTAGCRVQPSTRT